MTLGAASLLLGALAAGFLLYANADARPSPPCPEGWTESPDAVCMQDHEACNAYFSGTASQTVRCNAESEDGKGTLVFSLTGSGRATVRVLDAAGSVAYTKEVPWNAAFADSDVFEAPPGEWTLEVTFRNAQGSGRIVLWG